MASHLPTHFETLIPLLTGSEQVQEWCPWQRVLALTFLNETQGAVQYIYVTVTGTDDRYVLDVV